MRAALWMAYSALMVGVLTGCDVCENESTQSVTSPSGGSKAVVFHRECGATVGSNTQISIIPSSKSLPNDPGNVVIVDGMSVPQVQWETESTLRIGGLGPGRIFKAEERVGRVSITYAP